MTDNSELVEADCGHETTEKKRVWDYDISLCPRCYQPFRMEQWPDTLGEYTRRVIEGGSGIGSRSTRRTKHEYLLGLDNRGRAVYHDEDNTVIKWYVPAHDDAYAVDRANRSEEVSGYVHQMPHEATIRPKRYVDRQPEPAPATPGKFVTLPNGDHIVMVKSQHNINRRKIGTWLRSHLNEFKQVKPVHVRKYDLEDYFDPTNDGKRRYGNKLDRIVEEVLNAVDVWLVGESPNGPWHYDKITVTREGNRIQVTDIDGKTADSFHVDEIDDSESHEQGLKDHLVYLNNRVIDEL